MLLTNVDLEHDGFQRFLDGRLSTWRSYAADTLEFRTGGYFVAPLAVDYSYNGEFLAITGEAGILTIYSHPTRRQEQLDLGTGDAMTDIQWRIGDLSKILLSSADGHCYIYNPEYVMSGPIAEPVACFDGGGEAVKCARWSPVKMSNLIAIGGRDGNIRLFDTRNASKSSTLNRPDLTIDGAHCISSSLSGLQRRSSNANSVISSMQFLPFREHYLCSIGQPDYDVKIWDCRYSKAGHPADVFPNPTSRTSSGSKRSRAFVDVTASPDGCHLYALNSNGHVYKVATSNFSLEREFAHPKMRTNSFYLRSSVSADGQWVACGSVGDGTVWVWSCNGTAAYCLSQDHLLEGENAECTGIAWRPDAKRDSSASGLACCLDSGYVTQWGSDLPNREGTMFKAESVMACNDHQSLFMHTEASIPSPDRITEWPPLPHSLPHRPGTPSNPIFSVFDSQPTLSSASKKPRTILDYFPSSGRSSPLVKR